MVETDWREILSFSQRELRQADKEKLCESLSWMEADDIELNFSDLKTLFRLAQDILKYKSEQVTFITLFSTDLPTCLPYLKVVTYLHIRFSRYVGYYPTARYLPNLLFFEPTCFVL